MASARFWVIVAFALAGAVASVVGMPSVLDWVFDTVQEMSGASRVAPVSEAAPRPTYRFYRLVFGEPGTSREQRREEAERTAASIRRGETTLGAIVQARAGVSEAPVVSYTEGKLTDRNELRPLLSVRRPGQLSPVLTDPETKSPVLYEFLDQREALDPAAEPPARGYPGARQTHVLAALAVLGAVIGAGLGALMVRGFDRSSEAWQRMDTGDKVTLFIGVFAGIVGSLPFLIAFGNLGPVVAPLLTMGLTIGFSALAVQALRSMEDVLPWAQKGRVGKRSGIKVFDTNVLIDGRIFDLARTGFLEGEFYVPKFVLAELQHIADSSDALRRQRGRRGLDVLRLLQDDFTVEVGTHDKFAGDDREPVDARLVKLAQALGADLVSNDYNLNKVASIQKVRVLNVNDLALALRPNLLPGETIDLLIIREGSQAGQGVGYLDDGTMVVVEGAKPFVGETIHVSVTQVIQTERGKLIFGEVEGLETEPEPPKPRRSTPRTGRP